MAVSKALLAAVSVVLMTLLTTTAAAPAAEVATASNADYEDLHIEGLSAAVEAPALAGLAAHSYVPKCNSYFPCGEKTTTVVVRRSFPCFFREARTTPRSAGGGGCRPFPYNCKQAVCTGWRECLCEQCKRVKFTYQIYCEKP